MNGLKEISVPQLNQLDLDKWAYINKWIRFFAQKKSAELEDYAALQKEADDLMNKYWEYGKKRSDGENTAEDHYIYNIMTSAMDVVTDFAKRFDVKSA